MHKTGGPDYCTAIPIYWVYPHKEEFTERNLTYALPDFSVWDKSRDRRCAYRQRAEHARQRRRTGCLEIEEETASFLLPFIVDIDPEFSQRYYLEPNHLSARTWQRILLR